MKPKIVMQDNSGAGYHNNNSQTESRLLKGNTFKDLSTICIIPVPGNEIEKIGEKEVNVKLNGISPRVLSSWFGLMSPMNQKFTRIFMSNMEVGDAYNKAIEAILASPELSKWKYIMTMEWDNIPPPDGLLKLYEGIAAGYDAVGGLYWTKGEGGQPMIYGDPNVMPRNFIPQMPLTGQIQRCNGLGMGFNLFKMEIFKDKRLPKPWFKTVQEYTPGVGVRGYTQDLYLYENAGNLGYKFASCNNVLVGHLDVSNDFVW